MTSTIHASASPESYQVIPQGVIIPENKAFGFSDADLTHHLLVFGQAGMGKSVLANNLFFRQAKLGQGAILIDTGLAEPREKELAKIASLAGRENDFKVIALRDSSSSLRSFMGQINRINLADNILDNKLLYISLPLIDFSHQERTVARAFVEMLHHAIFKLHASCAPLSHSKSCLMIFDNYHSYAAPADIKSWLRSRAIKIGLCAIFQDTYNSPALDHVEMRQFLSNAATKIFFNADNLFKSICDIPESALGLKRGECVVQDQQNTFTMKVLQWNNLIEEGE